MNRKYIEFIFFALVLFPIFGFSSDKKIDASLHITGHESIDFVLIDPNKKKAGINPFTKSKLQTLPSGAYSRTVPIDADDGTTETYPELDYARAPIGEYEIQIFSVSGGKYDLDVRSIVEGVGGSIFIEGFLKPKQSDSLKFKIAPGKNPIKLTHKPKTAN